MTDLELPGYDLWLTFIKNVHVVPSRLDMKRFENALSAAATLYPHTLGRLRCEKGSWKITLTDSPIPLLVSLGQQTPKLDHSVIQEDLDLFLPNSQSPVNSDEPLLLVRATLFESQTIIGVSWYHALGDAITLWRFMHLVSQFYQGDLAPPLHVPVFGNTPLSEPSEYMKQLFRPLLPHMAESLDESEIGKRYAELQSSIVHLRWRMPRCYFQNIQSKLQTSSNLKLSLQDCITAYFVTLVNRCHANTISKVTNAASYRRCSAHFVKPDIAGNAIYIVATERLAPDEREDSGLVAQKIRQSLITARQDNFLESYMSVASHLMLADANSSRRMFFGSDPDVLSVNSTLSLPQQAIHFGWPGKTSFHTVGYSRFYLRVFTANPSGPNDDADDFLELSMGVPAHLRQQIQRTFEVEAVEF
ncbi:hypothetical protein C8J56DRAFT_1055565 [Mycena floridula]|nr:hypothetical protein C8J56DRAFT_1055565 [Mycena floridula]